ncbi:MAG TPA: hypothetical protein DCR43_02610 [Bacteroidales bacterium]|nr:MAG: hypothetical protein A2X11_07280 [Bacteroidetes bacterium GWE2_42_24]OFY29533.1 MAG: hypothetical protein A2X09_04320 [Bacteroidetes bacterium GWF2_43_11]PKP27676.1 MAG: hypothetical protein CVU06_01330 [Bacteroidetes bacterium HGW-Bacteroidetes-22]HAQ64735.1 hypothetical protein [Bacteroidales bacterium]HBZ67333.1 hypothetical protein [Bacteroidales bacterium]
MKKLNWRKWNRAIHRDLGYLFFAITVIYGLSGIAVNHISDWNPNYVITQKEVTFRFLADIRKADKEAVKLLLKPLNEDGNYKKHYFPDDSTIKIFVNGGNIVADLNSGDGWMETLRRRPVFNLVNFLHYNPGKWWTWVADIFAGSLIVLAFSGIFLIKGKNGITGRGAILTAIGIAIPLLFILLFY